MKLVTHSQFGYDTFPNHHPEEGEKYIDVWQDNEVIDHKGGIALLLEPRSMIGSAYEYVENHPNNYDLIFTHDSRILRDNNNARFLIWADVWINNQFPYKQKGISLVTSYKNWCPLHRQRIELADFYKDSDKVDVFRTYSPEDKGYLPKEYLEPYMYSIIIENDIDDLWFTEKLLNCFATKTIPIYVGARRINQKFNTNGMIICDSVDAIPAAVEGLHNLGMEKIYKNAKGAINDNFKRVQFYRTGWLDRFFRQYGEEIEELWRRL